MFISSRFPGSVHDQRVLRKTIGIEWDAGFRPFENAVILADSAYAATDWVIPMKEGNMPDLKQKFYK